ncbi:MAG TPA: hypothetical protein VGB42_00555 [Candidatus Thermoplasmatota archaeon]
MAAWFKCPNEHVASLLDHTIGPDGTVSPSVQCFEEACEFHEEVRLLDWYGT